MTRTTIALTLAMIVGGCSTATLTPIVAPTVPVSIPQLQPLTLSPIVWTYSAGVYSLDEANYQALNLNLVDIRRYITEQRAVIDLLKALPR